MTRTKMTKDQKNERTRDLRFQRRHQRRESMKHSIIEYWLRAEKELITHEEMLEYRNKWLYPYQNGMSVNDIEYLAGVWDTMQVLAYKRLVFCYIIDGEFIESDKLTDEHYPKCSNDNAHHCWKTPDGYKVWH